jgi:acetoacetate decarboxylase
MNKVAFFIFFLFCLGCVSINDEISSQHISIVKLYQTSVQKKDGVDWDEATTIAQYIVVKKGLLRMYDASDIHTIEEEAQAICVTFNSRDEVIDKKYTVCVKKENGKVISAKETHGKDI